MPFTARLDPCEIDWMAYTDPLCDVRFDLDRLFELEHAKKLTRVEALRRVEAMEVSLAEAKRALLEGVEA
jgi:hypothetical protein